MPNFKFGQAIHGNVYHRGVRGRNATTKRRTTATCGPVAPASGASTPYQGLGGSGGYDISRFNPAYDRLEEGSVIEDWIPRDLPGINKMLRIIYNRDAIAGPAVDIMAQLPWSEFDLHGIEDKTILEFYEGAAQLFGDKAQDMPAITTEFLVLGRFCASLLYDEDKGYWTDFVPHDSDFLTITPIPIRGFDPKIDLMLSPGIRQFLQSQDYRDQVAVQQLPPELLRSLRAGGAIPLDPLATLYVRRKSSPYDHVGTSIYTRVLPFWALEKALMNASVTAARRRAGNILHVQAGIEDKWEPSPQEMDDIAGLFIQADEDPVGAVVATRTGVEASEIRQGGDIWKWSEEWQTFAEGKMRALGISEALLSGDACVTGDTLIQTDQGLIKIGDLRRKEDGAWQDIDLTVASLDGPGRAVKWLYNGVKPTLHVQTDLGYDITCTHNHPLLVLRGTQTIWVPAGQLRIGDVVCLGDKPLVRDEKLPINLGVPTDVHHGGKRKTLSCPTVMTPELAFVLGLLVAEGTIRPTASQVRFSNTDQQLHEIVKRHLRQIFGVEASIRLCKASKTYKGFQPTKRCFETIVCSKTLVEWLTQLGCVASHGQGGSRKKVVPWSILQSDAKSQLAYLAGFIEGDGSTVGSTLTLHSSSQLMLRQLQALLLAHGYVSRRYKDRIALLVDDSVRLWDAIKCHMVKTYNKPPCKIGRVGYELPIEPWRQLLRDRMFRKKRSVWFVDDVGQPHRVPDWNKLLSTSIKCFRYTNYANGKYDSFLMGLKNVNANAHDALVDLLERGHVYTAITNIQNAGEQDVYDLSMFEHGVPAFVANGILVHNTYANMETARSVFTEQVLQLRQHLTNQVYYRRFKTLARAHGFRKTSKANLDHRVRIRKSGGLNNLSHEEAMEIPEDDLIVPTMQWRKSLLPEGDREYLELLEMLKEQGVPIPLKVWAARGGYDIHEAMDMLDDDIKLRKQIDAWKKATGGGDEEEGGAWGEAENEGSPFWDRSQQFLQLSRGEARACLKHLVGAANEHVELLGDADEVMRVLHGQLGNRRKVELMAYLLMRLQLTASIPISHETAEDIATHLLLHETLSERRRHQELTAFAQITGRRTPNVTAAPASPDVLTAEVKEQVDRAQSSEFLDPTAPTLLSGAA